RPPHPRRRADQKDHRPPPRSRAPCEEGQSVTLSLRPSGRGQGEGASFFFAHSRLLSEIMPCLGAISVPIWRWRSFPSRKIAAELGAFTIHMYTTGTEKVLAWPHPSIRAGSLRLSPS